MEYRLLKLDNEEEYMQIFNEEKSELIGSVVKHRRLFFIPTFLVRIDDSVVELKRGLLRFRKWKIDTAEVFLSWKVLRTRLRVNTGNEELSTDGPARGKLTLTNSQGRTAMIIEIQAFESGDMLRLQTFDRLEESLALGIAVLMTKYFDLWY